jgi:hypothetical protein
MKTKACLASLAVVIALASSHQALAQTFLDQNGPDFQVAWSSSAALCQLMPGSAASTVNIVTGTVSFAPNSYGTIGLICSMSEIGNGLLPADISDLAYSFSNPSPQFGCTSSTYFVDRTTGLHDGWILDGIPRNGVRTVNVQLTKATLPLTNHTYDTDVYLFRPKSAVALCNPVAYSLFMEGIGIQ